MEKSRKLFVANIIRLRNRRNLTQAEAAHGAGVNLRTYQKYESGQVFPSSPTLSRLSETFGVQQSDLFADTTLAGKADLIIRLTSRLGTLDERELGALDSMIDSFLSLRPSRNESAG